MNLSNPSIDWAALGDDPVLTSVEQTDHRGCTALMKALRIDAPLEQIQALLDAGSNPNHLAGDMPVAGFAVLYASPASLRALAQAGAYLGIRDRFGDGLPHLLTQRHAQDGRAHEVLQILLAAGCDLDAKDSRGVSARQALDHDPAMLLVMAQHDAQLASAATAELLRTELDGPLKSETTGAGGQQPERPRKPRV